jgi:hypothetical protein
MMAYCRMNKIMTIADGMATEQGMVANVQQAIPDVKWNPENEGIIIT